MTQHIIKNNQDLHQYAECGLLYVNKEMAKKCEKWCKEHKSCNLEIIKHATK